MFQLGPVQPRLGVDVGEMLTTELGRATAGPNASGVPFPGRLISPGYFFNLLI